MLPFYVYTTVYLNLCISRWYFLLIKMRKEKRVRKQRTKTASRCAMMTKKATDNTETDETNRKKEKKWKEETDIARQVKATTCFVYMQNNDVDDKRRCSISIQCVAAGWHTMKMAKIVKLTHTNPVHAKNQGKLCGAFFSLSAHIAQSSLSLINAKMHSCCFVVFIRWWYSGWIALAKSLPPLINARQCGAISLYHYHKLCIVFLCWIRARLFSYVYSTQWNAMLSLACNSIVVALLNDKKTLHFFFRCRFAFARPLSLLLVRLLLLFLNSFRFDAVGMHSVFLRVGWLSLHSLYTLYFRIFSIALIFLQNHLEVNFYTRTLSLTQAHSQTMSLRFRLMRKLRFGCQPFLYSKLLLFTRRRKT